MSAAVLSQEWFSMSDLAAMKLPDAPATERSFQRLAARRDWLRPEWQGRVWRPRQGAGGGVELHYSCLPHEAQVALALRFPAGATVPEVAAPGEATVAELERAERWARFEKSPAICTPVAAGADCKGATCRQRCQRVAHARLAALQAVEALERSMPRRVAIMQVASARKVSRGTVFNWFAAIANVDRVDRLPALLPHHAGMVANRVDMPKEAWDALMSDWLRLSAPPFEGCWRRLQDLAKERGWTLVSARTAERRLNALPEPMRVIARKGEDAWKRMYPAQERDRSVFYAMQAVNNDAHTWDVRVIWPDGEAGRPHMEAFADIYSGKILSFRFGKTVSSELVRLAFGDMVEAFGIPQIAFMDNGREQTAKKITGGIAHRFRGRKNDDDPDGILKVMDVDVRWTTPYSGQSKPIERSFRDMAHDIAKHPAFEGAYTGHHAMAKPENYGTRAVPLAEFEKIVRAEIAKWNARPARRSAVCAGRSFDEAFTESYQKNAHLIRRPSEAQRRLWLMTSEAVTVSSKDGCIRVLGNRFHGDCLAGMRGTKVVVRYDPADVHADLHVYRLDGSYVGAAPCIDMVGFGNRDAAQTHGRARNAAKRADKAKLDAVRVMDAAQVAALYAPADAAPPAPAAPETKVIRPVFGTSGNTALKPQLAADPAADIDFDGNFERNLARLRVVRAEGGGGL